MRAIVEGLQLAWFLGIRKVRVLSDSLTAMAILFQRFLSLYHQHAILLLQYQEPCCRQWEVTLSHSYYEANCVVDYLANWGHYLCFGIHDFVSPDRGLSHRHHYDRLGILLPGAVPVLNNI
ncbi:hypothetical protein LINGRAHAP2_LOCUS30795 [Linum grandiflorum]